MARSLFNTIDNLSLQDIESDADLIPLMTTEDEEALENEAFPMQYLYFLLETQYFFQE